MASEGGSGHRRSPEETGSSQFNEIRRIKMKDFSAI